MAWKVELSSLAQKNLDQLDPQIARRVLSFLHERVAPLDDPRSNTPKPTLESRIAAALGGSDQITEYRLEDGSVRLPKVLQNFMGQDRIVPRAKKA